MKKFAKKLAGWIVTYYYNRLYKKAVRMADAKHAETGKAFFVVDHLVKGQMLSVIDRAGFRKMKHDAQHYLYNKAENWQMYWSEKYNLKIVADGAWYRTPDASGQHGLSALQKEARRLMFIRIGLYRAKLIDSVDTNQSTQ